MVKIILQIKLKHFMQVHVINGAQKPLVDWLWSQDSMEPAKWETYVLKQLGHYVQVHVHTWS